MPKDYAKTSRPENHRALPGWVWLLAGLILGLFVALLIYINNNTAKDHKTDLSTTLNRMFDKGAKITREAKEKTKAKVAKAIRETRPKFDFYTILPELEVAIPEEELIKKARSSKRTSSRESDSRYILQAGSFRNPAQADRLKAQLALQGIVANIQSVKINDKDIWYRVRIGPLHNIASLNRTRKRLRENNIASIVVKEKK
ncbi:Cell division protein FtsN [hydrothermal vent metagenome]|uniref:Cell division protein FtsN n=1 Tax=hydrothermal vent metagenome TaxID=652676 RepID=A0A3B1C6N3_9ZZZZ